MDSKTFYTDGGDDAEEPIGLRPAEAAARLGVSVTTLYRLRVAGRIPFVKLAGAVIFRVASLDQFLRESEKRETPDTA
jgi:excisionase family DNA binding protein